MALGATRGAVGCAARVAAALLLAVAAALLTVVRAGPRDWDSLTFTVHDDTFNLHHTTTCPSGSVVWWGYDYRWNPIQTDACLLDKGMRDAVGACAPGEASCATNVFVDCEGDDEAYMHVLCGPNVDAREDFEIKRKQTNANGFHVECSQGRRLLYGWGRKFVTGPGNSRFETACTKQLNDACKDNKCVAPYCDTEGDDEDDYFMVCTHGRTEAFYSMWAHGTGASYLSLSCPSGMYTIDAQATFNVGGGGENLADSCARSKLGYFCNTYTNDLWNTSYTRQGACANGPCDDYPTFYTSSYVNMLCKCLPGHVKAHRDSADGCVACALGQYANDAQSACVMCPAGHACATPAAVPVRCAQGSYAASGATSCTPCPEGYICPHEGMEAPLQCGGPDVYAPCRRPPDAAPSIASGWLG